MSKSRVLIADDHTIFAECLRARLEPEFEVVGTVTDGRELIAAVRDHNPDVIVADVTMPVLNGIDAAAQLRDLGIPSRVVFLTMHRDVAYARRAMQAGAFGFVLKHSASAELVTAVREPARPDLHQPADRGRVAPVVSRGGFCSEQPGCASG
ncbi:MAG: response regulator transcription factor [Gemmataceae bacterium]